MSVSVKNLQLVLITWKDITSTHNGWIDQKDIEELEAATCYTPGWILKEDTSNYYIVSCLLNHKNEWSGSYDTVIPKGVVESVVVLSKTTWRRPRKYTRKATTNPIINFSKYKQ
jgi:hypothetical protein